MTASFVYGEITTVGGCVAGHATSAFGFVDGAYTIGSTAVSRVGRITWNHFGSVMIFLMFDSNGVMNGEGVGTVVFSSCSADAKATISGILEFEGK